MLLHSFVMLKPEDTFFYPTGEDMGNVKIYKIYMRLHSR